MERFGWNPFEIVKQITMNNDNFPPTSLTISFYYAADEESNDIFVVKDMKIDCADL